MASGFGVITPKGRCYPFWLDFTKCMQDDGTKQPSQCKLLAEDYIECLHHHKQILKLKRIAIETEKYKEANGGQLPSP